MGERTFDSFESQGGDVDGREALQMAAEVLEKVPGDDRAKAVCSAVAAWLVIVIERLPLQERREEAHESA